MTDLYCGELLQQMAQMPEAEDKRIKALSFALAKGKQWAMDFAVKSQTQAGIDKLDYEMLDILAVETNTQYYLENMPWEMKRAVLKGVLKWKALAGTAGAVREVVETIFGNGSLHEWFEYGGNPGYFKVDIGTMLTEENVAWFMRVVSQVKPARAHLESVTCHLEGDLDGPGLEPGSVVTEYGETKILSEVIYKGFVEFPEEIIPGAALRLRFPFLRERLWDGSWVLGGSHLLDARPRWQLEVSCSLCSSVGNYNRVGAGIGAVCLIGVKEAVSSDAAVGAPIVLDEGMGHVASLRFCVRTDEGVEGHVARHTHNYWFLDGSVRLDGSRMLDSVFESEREAI